MTRQTLQTDWWHTLAEALQRPPAGFAVDGLTPAAALEPPDRQALADVMRAAHGAGASVVAWGGGTQMGLGNPPRQLDAAVSLRQLNRLVDYAPQDLTVTVEAGMTLADLNRTLAERRQFLPLDPPRPEQATAGGTLAADASGPLRTRYGAARDLALASHVVLADGTPVKAGARVVKNVAGYDLTRLWIGSLGTLAILTEVTFKVYPLPDVRQTVAVPFAGAQDAAAFAVNDAWNSGPALEALEVLSPAAAQQVGSLSADRWWVLARFAGVEAAVSASVARLARADATRLADDAALWAAVRDLPAPWAEHGVTLRLGVLPTEVGDACGGLRAAAVTARPAVGLVLAHFTDPAAVSQAAEQARVGGGHAVITAAPAALKPQLSVWGPPGEAFDLMQKMKQEFDPRGVLSPGRFVGGI